jgi:hypothetical protein
LRMVMAMSFLKSFDYPADHSYTDDKTPRSSYDQSLETLFSIF